MRTLEAAAGRGRLPVDSPEFWRRVERTAVSSDPDVATAQVVKRMSELATTASSDPLVAGYARRAVEQFRGGPLWAAAGLDPFTVAPGDGRRDAMLAESVWWWAKHYLRFEHHSQTIWHRLRESNQWQLLISPDVLVRMRWPFKGDCAVYSTLIGAMLSALGLQWEFETVAADAEQPAVYSHVFVRVILPGGVRVPLDASHGPYAGWRVPAHDTFRSQVWDSSGRPVQDRAQFRGLHQYVRRGRRRGLGETNLYDVWAGADSSEGGTYDPPSGPNPTQVFLPSAGTARSGGDTNWGGIFGNLLNQWTAIGGKVLAPSVTYQRGPNGQVMYSAPAGSAAASSIGNPLSGGSFPSTWLLLGGGVLAVVVVMATAGKGGR